MQKTPPHGILFGVVAGQNYQEGRRSDSLDGTNEYLEGFTCAAPAAR